MRLSQKFMEDNLIQCMITFLVPKDSSIWLLYFLFVYVGRNLSVNNAPGL